MEDKINMFVEVEILKEERLKQNLIKSCEELFIYSEGSSVEESKFRYLITEVLNDKETLDAYYASKKISRV